MSFLVLQSMHRVCAVRAPYNDGRESTSSSNQIWKLRIPTFAIVRPRIRVMRTGEERLLDEVVSEIVAEFGSGFVRLCGATGQRKIDGTLRTWRLCSHTK